MKRIRISITEIDDSDDKKEELANIEIYDEWITDEEEPSPTLGRRVVDNLSRLTGIFYSTGKD